VRRWCATTSLGKLGRVKKGERVLKPEAAIVHGGTAVHNWRKGQCMEEEGKKKALASD
jgi:hypothetical protein